MPPPPRRPITLQPGTPVADAVTRAREAFARADAAGLDAAYQQAVGLAAGDPALWSALAADHAEGLRKLGRVTLALRRCDEYVGVGPNYVLLRLLRAEIRSALGDHRGADADAATIRTAFSAQSHDLTADDSARLHRVQGLSAADMGDLGRAVDHLDAAAQSFLEAGNQAGVAAIELDRLQLDVRQGDESAVSDVLLGKPPQTVSDYLLLAAALRRQLRYEEAFLVLYHGIDRDVDPALAWHVWYELILLLRLMRQDGLAQRLFPSLRAAVAASADPEAAAASVARLSAAGASSDAISPRFDRQIQHVRRLIIDARLDEAHPGEARLEEAEPLLGELRPRANTDRDIATWHLAAGELQLARRKLSEIRSCAEAAVGHLTEAVARCSAAALVEVRVCALRSLGHAYDRLDADEQAAACWAEAHRLEEGIAGRQLSDDVQMGMLQAAADEYDERINAAAEKLNNRGPEATAAIVVAMEAARGATILGRILPAENGFARVLPSPSDVNGAWRWVSDMADGLPPSQAAWIIHSTPDRVHHAVIGPGLLYYKSVPSQRKKLTVAIDNLMACWSAGEDSLEHNITSGEFDGALNEVAAQVGIDAVIPGLPPQVHRIAIVAGGELSDVPFAAMAMTGRAEPIGLRFALSDLPCLSARLPLYRRSRRLRGDRLLSISPPASGLARAAGRRADTPVDDADATRARLAAELKLRRHRLVRIDCHGLHEHHDPTMSWLQLAPAGPDDGRLRAAELQRMDLRGCGTLVLGACESGMSQRIGRDERIGFVRAAVHAGAPAVIAARWIAKDAVAATVLDRFEHYVRYLPRDLALQCAQLDVCRGAPGVPADIPAVDHPARWACWTLYGDSGWQTRAGPVRRALRRSLDERRRCAKHP
ncbi:MAG: CHAT domain-containing protein [Pseudonocardiaceae bacterium]